MKVFGKYESTAIESMPYVYLPGYASFCKKTGIGEVVFFLDQQENSIACLSWKNKFLSLLQPMHPPLNNNGERLPKELENTFLDSFVKVVKDKKIANRIVQSPTFAIFHATPSGSIKVPFGTYFLDLEHNSIESLTGRLHGKHRNVIRNAEKHGVQARFGEDTLKDFYYLYSQTMQRSGMSCEPIGFFEDLLRSMPRNIICGVSYHKDIPQGALLMPYTRFGAFYLYGASAEKIEVNGAMNYLHWITIHKLKQAGVKRYDFVGARVGNSISEKLRGIQQFKERFGSQLEKGFLWKKDISPVKCKAYDRLLALKLGIKRQKVPLDIISQEMNNDGNSQ